MSSVQGSGCVGPMNLIRCLWKSPVMPGEAGGWRAIIFVDADNVAHLVLQSREADGIDEQWLDRPASGYTHAVRYACEAILQIRRDHPTVNFVQAVAMETASLDDVLGDWR